MAPSRLPLFITAPRALEQVLAQELSELGLAGVELQRGGVSLVGDLEQAYRVCLYSRVANRVLLALAEKIEAHDGDALYESASRVPWTDHLDARRTFAVDCVATESPIENSQFAALRVKDAIVDQLRQRTGARPEVSRKNPDLRINLHLYQANGRLSLDLSGESLHRRGYRRGGAEAPVKENLAAGLLRLADWPARAARQEVLVDPMCGSGTFVIEAALIAADVAPGLLRDRFGFLGWPGHHPQLWQRLRDEARARDRREHALRNPVALIGHDASPRAIALARENARHAGVARMVRFDGLALKECSRWEDERRGIVVVNPPYGERMGEVALLQQTYYDLGRMLKAKFAGFTAYVLSGSLELTRVLGLKATRKYPVYNGAIDCRFLVYPIGDALGATPAGGEEAPPTNRAAGGRVMFRNRLEKRYKHLSKWAKRNDIECFRVYDVDLPEYAVAIDLYRRWVQVQEFQPPKEIDPLVARRRLAEVLEVVPEVLGVAPQDVFLKVRRRQRSGAQYNKLAEARQIHLVREGDCQFEINLSDYLDSGLFLDHRLTRQMLGDLARGRSFLNLFAYSGTASVHAIKGGADRSVAVDLSSQAIAWARRNYGHNEIREGSRHLLVQADCLKWIAACRERFGLIFLDPPTFSSSKRMDTTLDIQRDHVALIEATANLLDERGILIFSNNFSRFSMELDGLARLGLLATDLTKQTIPEDFTRRARVHQCWRIERRSR
jgi:23S rRNA (guanine2445-N2)-methyltransferase / 23S rRNA (guanine2069-N7)-methyltransferase